MSLKAHRTLYDPTGLKVVRLTDFGYEITNRKNFARVVFISDPKSVSRTTLRPVGSYSVRWVKAQMLLDCDDYRRLPWLVPISVSIVL